jgi:flagellar hook-basal body complex protein FliE
MSFANGLQGMQLPSGYGKIPGLPGVPNHPHLEGYVSAGERISGNSFGGTLSSMINHANDLMAQPEKLSVQAVQTGKVDIHEVMIALGKSEVAFKLISAVTQKTIGALDKLTSMQV